MIGRNTFCATLTGLALSAGLLLGGCGASTATPRPGFSLPVSTLQRTDIDNAGVPAVETLGGFADAAAGVSQTLPMSGTLAWDAPLASRNLQPLAGSAGWQLAVPDAQKQNRILGWLLYRFEGQPGSFLGSLESQFSDIADSDRIFYAVGNASSRSWEIGGRLNATGLQADSYLLQGYLVSLRREDWLRRFSLARNYVFPDGSSYLLIVIANPGGLDGQSGSFGMADIDWQYLPAGIARSYPDYGSAEFFTRRQSVDFDGESGIHRLSFDGPPGGGGLGSLELMLACPLDFDETFANIGLIIGDSQSWKPLTGQNYNYSLFRPGEQDFSRNGFRLGLDELDVTNYVGIRLLEMHGGTDVRNGIRGLLTYIGQPAFGAQVRLERNGQVLAETQADANGEFSFSGLKPGDYKISASRDTPNGLGSYVQSDLWIRPPIGE
ncbi:MAG: carboxypeptidase-like regulatory domain-containing protein [bacterium]